MSKKNLKSLKLKEFWQENWDLQVFCRLNGIQEKIESLLLSEQNDLELIQNLLEDRLNFLDSKQTEQVQIKELVLPVLCQIRYRQQAQKCLLKFQFKDSDFSKKLNKIKELRISFLSPVRAITVGQSAVFYDEDNLLGGGIIAQVF